MFQSPVYGNYCRTMADQKRTSERCTASPSWVKQTCIKNLITITFLAKKEQRKNYASTIEAAEDGGG